MHAGFPEIPMKSRKIAIAAGLVVAITIAGTTGVKMLSAPGTDSLRDTAGTAKDTPGSTMTGGSEVADAGGYAISGSSVSDTAAVSRQMILQEQRVSTAPDSQPPRTTMGPDGKPRDIVYNQGMRLNHAQLMELKAVMLEDMKLHPEAFAQVYGMEAEEIQEILSGKREFPHSILAEVARM